MNTYPRNEPPRIVASPPPSIERGDATGGFIPYKNPHALIAYYLAFFSIMPVLGFFTGATALGLGISGLKQREKRPIIRGAVHAWFGIIVGSLSVLLHLAAVVGFVVYRALR